MKNGLLSLSDRQKDNVRRKLEAFIKELDEHHRTTRQQLSKAASALDKTSQQLFEKWIEQTSDQTLFLMIAPSKFASA